MVKKTITYIDYNGVERTEDHYFNMNQAEILQLEMSVDGGWLEMVKKISATQDAPAIMKVFREVVNMSYGEKSADGRRFIKSPELTEAFVQTEAYSNLFVELITKPETFADFMNQVVETNQSKFKNNELSAKT